MQSKRITIFAGHYGSGKTTLALAWARQLKAQHARVALCDLDIVNPYFRTADAEQALNAEGISLITSPFAGTNVDAPAMPAATQSIFDDPGLHAVIDLGGDDRGALALGRYAKQLRDGGEYDMFLVINPFRPLTRRLKDIVEIHAEIESSAKVPFTGIVNNANLGRETTEFKIIDTLSFAQEASRALKLPIKMTTIDSSLIPPEDSETYPVLASLAPIFPIQPFSKDRWQL